MNNEKTPSSIKTSSKKEQQKSSNIVTPRCDLIFKRIFGSEENKDILRSFLSAVLDLPPEDIKTLTIKDPHFIPKYKDKKLRILDIKIETSGNQIIDIEMQRAMHIYLRDRIVRYNAQLISEQQTVENDYKLRRAKTIVIADFNLLPEETSYFSRYRMKNVINGNEFSDAIEYNILEIRKMPKTSDQSPLYEWLKFLRIENEEDVMEMKPSFPEIQKAIEELRRICSNPEDREKYAAEEKALTDYLTDVHGNYLVGHEKGQYSILRKMHENGLSEQTIAEYTSLPLEDVKRILKNGNA